MKQNKHYKKWRRRLVHGGTTRLKKPAGLELPPEAPDGNPHDPTTDSGVLRLDNSSRLPTALAEASDTGEDGLMPSRLVLSITLMAVVLIGIITWFVARMPNK